MGMFPETRRNELTLRYCTNSWDGVDTFKHNIGLGATVGRLHERSGF